MQSLIKSLSFLMSLFRNVISPLFGRTMTFFSLPNSNHMLINFNQMASIWINKAMLITYSTEEIYTIWICFSKIFNITFVSLDSIWMRLESTKFTRVYQKFSIYFHICVPPWDLYHYTVNVHNLLVFSWSFYLFTHIFTYLCFRDIFIFF